ncbi:hypothetical protein Ancab_001439 [Ancistrocladus abbreviatus]
MDPRRHTESVLSKLMGLDKLPNQPPPLGRQRVLSQSYFENIASITHREKWAFDENRSTMDVERRLETKDAFEGRQRQGTGEHHYQLAMKQNANLSIKKAETEGLTKRLKDARSLTEDQNFQPCIDFSYSLKGLRDKHLYSLTDIVPHSHLTLSESTSASTGSNNSGRVKSQSDKKGEPYLLSSGLVLKSDNGNVHHAERSSLSPYSLLGNRTHSFSSSVRSNALYFEARGTRSVHQSMVSFNHGSKFPGDVAKQITSDIKRSMWHHYSNISGSEHEKSISSSPCQRDLKNWNKAASGVPASRQRLAVSLPGLTCQILDGRLPKDSHLPGRYNGNMDLSPSSTSYDRDYIKPVIGPSTSTQRSRRRHFIIHRDWCLYPRENDNLECMKTREDNCDPKGCLGPKHLRSVLSPDSESNHAGQGPLSIVKDLNKLEEENLSEENSVVQSLGCNSACSDIEVVTNCETQKISDELLDRLQDFSLKDSIASRPLTCDFAYLTMDGEEVNNAEKEDVVVSSKHKTEQQSQPSLFQKDAESNLDDLDTSIQQFRDDALMASYFAEMEKEPIEAYVGSPDSVLESIEISPDAEDNERTGLKMKLKLFRADSLEMDSKGLGIMVSGDEETEEVSFGSSRENEKKMRICNIPKSQDFSYLVDVLVESGFDVRNLKDTEIQQSLEFAIDPSVFDVLEEKYGKQTSWKRSERRLLFDRINLGLAEILQSFKGIGIESRSVAKRFVCLQHPELIADELWSWLVNQEKEARRESSDKVIDRELKWLELGEDISAIVREIEKLLIDELVEEI